MRKWRAIRVALLGSGIVALASQASAQMKRPAPDEHGIDVISGMPLIPSGKLTIGDPSQGGLEFYRVWQGGGWYDNIHGTVVGNGSSFTVTLSGSVETFTLAGGVYNSDDGNGSTLTVNVSGTWTYTLADGTVVTYENPGTLGDVQAGIDGMLSSIVKPNGFTVTFNNKYQGFCEKVGSRCDSALTYYARLQSVTTNTG